MWYNVITINKATTTGGIKKGWIIMTDNMRANRVAIKANGENFIATFYRTHTIVADIHSENTEWKAPADGNKALIREDFRKWITENAGVFNIEYDPTDRRADGNVRKANYTTDDELVNDAMAMLLPQMQDLAGKVTEKYPNIEWGGVAHDEIVPSQTTGSGRDLSTMGITDGKYNKSGNWAWAVLKFTVTMKYSGNEVYIPTEMQLVSGQLKKADMGIQKFTDAVKAEIIAAGLATAEEIDPPKEKKSKPVNLKKDEPAKEEPVTEEAPAPVETPAEETPAPKKRGRKRKTTNAEESLA